MNTLTNQPSQPLIVQPVQPAQSAYRSCLYCSYVGETPHTACPNCGKTPLMKVSTLQIRGVLKIVRGFLTIVIVGVALLAIYNFSLWNRSFFGNSIFHGDVRSNLLAYWGMFLAVAGSLCEIVVGIWLLAYSKLHPTLKTIKPLLRLLYILTAVTFFILTRISG